MITHHPDGTASLDDGTGSIAVALVDAAADHSDGAVDIVGFVTRSNDRLAITEGLPKSAYGGPSREAEADSPADRELAAGSRHGDEEFRQLRPVEARNAHPVRLRAVVTSLMRERNFVFIQDTTSGIFMVNTGPPVEPGQVVDVTGESASGDFAPVIGKGRARVVASPACRIPCVTRGFVLRPLR